MITMIILVALLVGFFRLFGFGLQAFGRVIGWLIGAVITVAVIAGIFGIVGTALSVAFGLLPVIALVALGVFIGRNVTSSDNKGGSKV